MHVRLKVKKIKNISLNIQLINFLTILKVMRFRVRPSKNRELPLIVSARLYLSKLI